MINDRLATSPPRPPDPFSLYPPAQEIDGHTRRKRTELRKLGVSLIGVGTVLRLERGYVVNGPITKELGTPPLPPVLTQLLVL